MCLQVNLGFVLVAILAVVHTGSTLRCWKCNSQYDVTCRDYFNVTKINQNRRNFERVNVNHYDSRQQLVRNDPYVDTCQHMSSATYASHKNVCLKKVIKGQHDNPSIVSRECRMVVRSLKAGECPVDVGRENLEYCGTCEEDECNGAPTRATSVLLASLIPVSLVLFLRH